MREARAVDPRTGAPSITNLAGLSGVAVETVRKLVYGIGTPRTDTVERVAHALGLDIRIVSDWSGQHRAVAAPFTLPTEAALLDERERDVITELVRVMTAGRRSTHAQQQEPIEDSGSTTSSSTRGQGRRRGTPMTDRTGSFPVPTPEWTLDLGRLDEMAARRVKRELRDPNYVDDE